MLVTSRCVSLALTDNDGQAWFCHQGRTGQLGGPRQMVKYVCPVFLGYASEDGKFPASPFPGQLQEQAPFLAAPGFPGFAKTPVGGDTSPCVSAQLISFPTSCGNVQ